MRMNAGVGYVANQDCSGRRLLQQRRQLRRGCPIVLLSIGSDRRYRFRRQDRVVAKIRDLIGVASTLELQLDARQRWNFRRQRVEEFGIDKKLFLLLRGNQVQQIRADTVFQAGDKVLAVAKGDAGESVLRRELIGDDEPVGAAG